MQCRMLSLYFKRLHHVTTTIYLLEIRKTAPARSATEIIEIDNDFLLNPCLVLKPFLTKIRNELHDC